MGSLGEREERERRCTNYRDEGSVQRGRLGYFEMSSNEEQAMYVVHGVPVPQVDVGFWKGKVLLY